VAVPMSSSISELFRCPDCDQPSLDKEFRCKSCGRVVRVDDNLIDLLPRTPPPLRYVCRDSVRQWYLEQYQLDPLEASPKAGWGGEQEGAIGYNLFVRTMKRWVENEALAAQDRSLLIDLSAGFGYYVSPLARHFEHVLHCDLSLPALLAARQNAPANVWFVRCDFRRPPLAAGVASVVMLLDAFVYYGPEDDRATVARMIEAVRPGGRVIFDLHTRRWFDWKQVNFHYSKSERERLLAITPSGWRARTAPFGRWPTGLVRNRLAWHLSQASVWLPPIRTAHVFERPARS
jgi:SAM-dependent methyltransferase